MSVNECLLSVKLVVVKSFGNEESHKEAMCILFLNSVLSYYKFSYPATISWANVFFCMSYSLLNEVIAYSQWYGPKQAKENNQ